VRVPVSPPHPKIFEANREVIKDANLIFPETSSKIKMIALVFHSNVVTLAGVAQWQSSGVPR
jgi:hypothetical protein